MATASFSSYYAQCCNGLGPLGGGCIWAPKSLWVGTWIRQPEGYRIHTKIIIIINNNNRNYNHSNKYKNASCIFA